VDCLDGRSCRDRNARSRGSRIGRVRSHVDDSRHSELRQNSPLNSDRVKFQTKDPTDVRVQKLVFAAGAYSGWHHHPGIVVVAVESGAVTLWDSDCTSKTYGPGLPNGGVFVEGGDDPVQATSASGATVYVTYVAPNANPPVFRIEDDPPPCA